MKETDVSGRNKDEEGMTPQQGNEESMDSDVVGQEIRRDEETAEDESSMEDSALAQKLDAMNKLLSRLSNRIDKVKKKKASTGKDVKTEELMDKITPGALARGRKGEED